MSQAKFDQSHVQIGGVLSAVVAVSLIASFSTLRPTGLSADGASFAIAGAAVAPGADAENALIATRIEALDLSKLSADSYGD